MWIWYFMHSVYQSTITLQFETINPPLLECKGVSYLSGQYCANTTQCLLTLSLRSCLKVTDQK